MPPVSHKEIKTAILKSLRSAKPMIITLFLSFFLLGILTKSSWSVVYASQGLHLWLFSMLPSLLPFMILTGIFIRTDKAEDLAGFFSPMLGRLFSCSKSACFVIVIGFLCGFPMGAKTISDLYDRGRLDRNEARWLLAFCNNLGPAFLSGFVLPLLGARHPLICLAGIYGIPLLYGFVLHFLPCYRKDDGNACERKDHLAPKGVSIWEALPASVSNAMTTILKLGGYMILFNVLNLIPHWLTGKSQPFLSLLFEITSGLQAMNGAHPIICMSALAFGGLSCLAQTISCLRKEELATYIGEYVIHKCILAGAVACYFSVTVAFIPDLFLP